MVGRGYLGLGGRGWSLLGEARHGLVWVSWRSTARFGMAGPGLVGVSRFGEVRFG